MRSEKRLLGVHRSYYSAAPLAIFATLLVLALILAGCSLFPTDAATLGTTKYAVIVGINDYIDSNVNDLHYCVADAQSVSDTLTAAGWTVDLITAESNEAVNQYATKAKIEAAIEATPSNADTFLFYYSGHGSIDSDDNAYLIPSDFDGATYSTMISTTEFSSWLASVTAKNKTIILDSCFSGGFIGSSDTIDSAYDYTESHYPYYTYLQKSSAATMFFRFGDLLAQNAVAASKDPSSAPLVISAAGWNAESQEDGYPYYHGIFTYYFLQAAQTGSNGSFMNGDSDRDGVLSCLEAYHYAEKQLEAQSNEFGFVPHISGGLRDFALIDAR